VSEGGIGGDLAPLDFEIFRKKRLFFSAKIWAQIWEKLGKMF